MASGAEKQQQQQYAPQVDNDEQHQPQEDDANYVNQQPIEISSDSSIADSGSEANLESDSEISIVDDDSASESDSDNDERLRDKFEMILAMPFKEHNLYMQLCHTAFKLNAFENINVAIGAFEKYSTIPAHIWLRYLKTLKAVTQTPAEYVTFYAKCATALSSYYDNNLAKFVLQSLNTLEPAELWMNLLSDYAIECPDIKAKLRPLLQADAKEKELEQTLSEQCVAWTCSDKELQEMSQLIGSYRLKLKESSINSSSSWLPEMFLLRIDTWPVSKRCKLLLAKVIYELSLAKFSTNSELWLKYIAYMETPLNEEEFKEGNHYQLVCDGYLKSKPLELIRRALFAKASVKLNHKFLQLMEQHNFTIAQIDEELGQLFARIEPYIEMTVELQLDYLGYRVRHTNANEEEQVAALRAAFRHVWDRLSEQYGESADTGYEVLQLWALVEYSRLKSPNEGAAIWSEIFSYSGSSDRVDLWLACAQMDGEYNAGRNIRSLLQQALRTLPAGVVGISDLYRRYERCFGSYDTIAACQAYCMQIQQDNQLLSPQRTTTFAQGRRQPTQPLQRAANKKPFEKRSLKKELPAPQKKSQPSPSQPPPTPTPPAKKETFEAKAANFKYSTQLEANKIFIKNLHADCTQQELSEAFQVYGHIKDVRLVFKPNQRFKGFAYIEFELPEQAQKAVEGANGLELGGLPIVVAISNPPPRPANVAFAPKVGQKRRMPTTLIPTKLVMLEAKRRKKLDVDESTTSSSTSMDANGKASSTNNDDAKFQTTHVKPQEETTSSSKANKEATTTTGTAAPPKSNDDFRKLFNI